MFETLLPRKGRCCASTSASSQGIFTTSVHKTRGENSFKFPLPPPTSTVRPGRSHPEISRYHEPYSFLSTGFSVHALWWRRKISSDIRRLSDEKIHTRSSSAAARRAGTDWYRI